MLQINNREGTLVRMVALSEFFGPLLRRYLDGPLASANPADIAGEIFHYWASTHLTSGNSARHVHRGIPLRNLIRDCILLSGIEPREIYRAFNFARIQTCKKRINGVQSING